MAHPSTSITQPPNRSACMSACSVWPSLMTDSSHTSDSHDVLRSLRWGGGPSSRDVEAGSHQEMTWTTHSKD